MSGAPPPIEPASLARRLFHARESGVLSTLSCELSGYPFGSVTPFVTTHTAEVVVYVSGIAQHTANMNADPRVSLTVLEDGSEGAQALGRATLIGDAEPVPGPELGRVEDRYFRLFPAAEAYASTHDFAFYRIRPKRVRYIGGFGRIHWIEGPDWSLPAPEWADAEAEVVGHMNRDHAEAVCHIAERAGLLDARAGGAELIAVDPEGTHLRSGKRIAYAAFETPAFGAEAIRQQMITLARA